MEIQEIHQLLKSAGFPPFKIGDDGFPDPGEVVRHSRLKCKMTQADMARQLDLSEEAIGHMERYNKGLDSINRRRAVANLLGIPPILMGLGGSQDLAAFLSEQGKAPPKVAAFHEGHVRFYADTVDAFKRLHGTWTAQDKLSEMQIWIDSIIDDIRYHATGKHQEQLQGLLFELYELVARIYSDDIGDFPRAHWAVKEMRQIASSVDDSAMKAVAFNRLAYVNFAERDFTGAFQAIDGASIHSVKAEPMLHSAILTTASLAHALVGGLTERSRTHIQHLLDQGRTIAGDNTGNGYFSSGKYLTHTAETLIAIQRPKEALIIINQAEKALDPSERRRLSFLDILRAESQTQLGQYESASSLLYDALGISFEVKSDFQIKYVARIASRIRTAEPSFASDNLEGVFSELATWQMKRML